jgi:hypothetical protein
LPARVLDLRADQADLKPFQRVPLWRDASPAGQHFRQNNPLLQPEIAPNAMGKEQALMFDGKFMTSTFTPSLATYTLLMVVKDAGSTQGSGARERVIVGVDPQAANAPRLLVFGDRDHPGSLVFKTDRGMARITLPLSERNRPFVLALRRDAEADTAFAGTHRATLTASPPDSESESASALPFLQLGGLAGQEKPFTGFIASLLLLDRDLSDPELLSLFPALEKKYGITP